METSSWIMAAYIVASWAVTFYLFVWTNKDAERGHLLMVFFMGPVFVALFILVGPLIALTDWLEKKYPNPGKIGTSLKKPLWRKATDETKSQPL